MRPRRAGRPPKFRARAGLVLYVEAAELRRLHRIAEAAGAATTSAWARAVLLKAASRDPRIPERRAACGRGAVEQEGDRPHGRERRARARGALLSAAGD